MDLKLDLTFAQVVKEQIDDYVHAEVLFYPVGAVNGMQMPQLTIGTWLETAWRLKAMQPDAPELGEAIAEVRRIQHRVPELYDTKARREFKSRLDTWGPFLDDALESKRGAGYASQVHNRLKLELLQDDVSQKQESLVRLKTMDARLKTRFKPGDFLLDPELAAAAPKDKFWWLWGTLAERT